MSWKENAIMLWNGNKITDHNRAPLSISVERLGTDERMADGTMRRYVVAKKRTYSASWSNLPSHNDSAGGMTTVDGGWAGDQIEAFHDSTDGAFNLVLKRGDGEQTDPIPVMITDFSKEVTKRGVVDLWSLDITLTEV